jgi:hypothetical protein
MSYLDQFLALLRDRQTFLKEIQQESQLQHKISALMIGSFICFCIYGAIVGSFHSPMQALSSAIKLPALYLLTLLVCLPALYIFNALFGSKLTIAQHFAYLLSAAAVIAILLCGFAPITLFFLTTISATKDYSFFLLLNVTIFALTGLFGVTFLYQAMRPDTEAQSATQSTEDDSQKKDSYLRLRSNILRFWLVLYGFVGSQLGWTLRPFFGMPGQFEFFRPREGNFLGGVWNALMGFLFS